MADRASQGTIVRLREDLGNQSYSYGVSSPEVGHLAPASDVRQACGDVVLHRCVMGAIDRAAEQPWLLARCGEGVFATGRADGCCLQSHAFGGALLRLHFARGGRVDCRERSAALRAGTRSILPDR